MNWLSKYRSATERRKISSHQRVVDPAEEEERGVQTARPHLTRAIHVPKTRPKEVATDRP